jgi:hypothetical protein
LEEGSGTRREKLSRRLIFECRTQMPREVHHKLKYFLAALLVTCLAAAYILIVFLLADDTKRSSPIQYSGVWAVTDHSGRPQGTIIFTPDGGFDDGEYVGHWSLQDARIHVQCWESEPASWVRHVFPKVDEVTFVPQFDKGNEVLSLKGKYVTLTRLADSG